jgi:meiotically up-regulated gene 157 (Mug157) protein
MNLSSSRVCSLLFHLALGATTGLSVMPAAFAQAAPAPLATVQLFPTVRRSPAERNFQSPVIEKAIKEFRTNVQDRELGWLFNNCFPNTLDTTVDLRTENGRPSTYVITGDIDAMWLRDSSAQVWPYLKFMEQDAQLRRLISGVITKQAQLIQRDPYANAFSTDETRETEWKNDKTDMKPGVHERKWEIDSLCYPIRLGYAYWKESHDVAPFDDQWENRRQSHPQDV